MNKRGKQTSKGKISKIIKREKINIYQLSEKELLSIIELMRNDKTIIFDENGFNVL